ncbi:MAG: TRAP transporter TatT component family protein [Vicinamibacterales bacterium]
MTLALQVHPAWRGRLVAVAGCAVLAAGCSIKTFAVNKLGDALSAPGPSVYTTDDDPELIRAALPFSLKTVESLLQTSPKHKGLLLTACSGFTSYANAFVQLDAEALESTDYDESERLKARARRLYLRARDYCMRRVELRRPGLREALARDPATALGTAKYDVEELYWLGASWGSAIAVGVDQPDLVADFPVVRTLMERALQIDEAYADGAIHEVFITLDGMSPSMGGDAARARQHFERAVALSKGKSASAYVAMAASVAQPAQNKEEFEQLLEQALAIDPDDVPDIRLATLIAQKRARILQSREDELFSDAGAPAAPRLTLALPVPHAPVPVPAQFR